MREQKETTVWNSAATPPQNRPIVIAARAEREDLQFPRQPSVVPLDQTDLVELYRLATLWKYFDL
tara:strand:- start:968 stop:1162 length:195 start_codon:yes stop_codon:yes gene_type:complete